MLGALFGRRSLLSQGAAAARSAARSRRKAGDVERATETVEAVRARLAELQAQIEEEAAQLHPAADPAAEEMERIEVRPKKSAIQVRFVALAWRS